MKNIIERLLLITTVAIVLIFLVMAGVSPTAPLEIKEIFINILLFGIAIWLLLIVLFHSDFINKNVIHR